MVLAIIAGFAAVRAADKGYLTVAEVISLPEDAARSARPVVVRGVLTYHEPGHRMAFLQDHTGAIYIHVVKDQDVSPGDYVEVRGFVDPGLNGRNIMGPDFDTSPTITRISPGTYPEPVGLSSMAGIEDMAGAYWIRAEVNVKSVTHEGDRARLTIEGFDHVPVFLAGITRPSMLPSHLSGLRVWVEGVIADSPVSEKPLILQRQILIPRLKHVTIAAEEFEGRFDLKESALSDLRWLQEREGPHARARVIGLVNWVKPGEGFFIQRGTSPAWVQCTTHEMPARGQCVECAGKPASYQGTGILTAALWRKCGVALEKIQALPMTDVSLRAEANHGALVSIDGVLVELLRGPSEDLLILQSGPDIVFSHLAAGGGLPRLAAVEKGSHVGLSGILLNRSSPALAALDAQGAFHLLIREPSDMTMISAPPFWTTGRLIIVLCAVLAAALLAGIWVLALRRKVRKQEILIRKTIARQVVEEERVRIAREWHDSFEQHFAGLTMLLDATSAIVPQDSPAGDMLGRAAKMADHSRAEARHAIWDLRASAIKSQTAFAVELEETLRNSWPPDAACRLDVKCEETREILPRATSLHLLRIASEAVTNALKHARCSLIEVSWDRAGDLLVLSITDDGTGLPAEAGDRAAQEGHFGLLGMRERALRLHGTLEILSPPADHARGTCIRISIPMPSSES